MFYSGASVFVFLIFVGCIHLSMCDYDCLCYYNTEKPVFSKADVNIAPIGYMYEFDCKAMIAELKDGGWATVAFEHQVGYVQLEADTQVQVCPGDPPAGDVIHTQPPSTVSSSTSVPLTSTESITLSTILTKMPSTRVPSSLPTLFLTTSFSPVTNGSRSTQTASTIPSSSHITSSLPSSSSTTTNTPTSSSTIATIPSSLSTTENAVSSTSTTENIPSSSSTTVQIPSSSSTTTNIPSSSSTTTNTPILSSTTTTIPTSLFTTMNAVSSPSTTENIPFSSSTTANLPFSSSTLTNIPSSSSTTTNTPSLSSLQTSLHPTSSSPSSLHSTSTEPLSTAPLGSTIPPITTTGRVELCPYRFLAESPFVNGVYPAFRQYSDYCYELRLKTGSWNEANADCKNRGGSLVNIANSTIQAMIHGLVKEMNPPLDVWIGLTDATSEGNWNWQDGIALTDKGYNNWAPTDPIYHDEYDCAAMAADDGRWKQVPCDSYLVLTERLPWVCQYIVQS